MKVKGCQSICWYICWSTPLIVHYTFVWRNWLVSSQLLLIPHLLSICVARTLVIRRFWSGRPHSVYVISVWSAPPLSFFMS
jgi:hypothetical protein